MRAPLCCVVSDSPAALEAAARDAGLEPFRTSDETLACLADFAVVDIPAGPGFAYALGARAGATVRAQPPYDRTAITRELRAARRRPPCELARLKTDTFRARTTYDPRRKQQLAAAREQGLDAVRAFDAGLGPYEDIEAAVLVDLLLSYRALSAWRDAIELVERLPPVPRQLLMVREQHALALNRAGQGEQAERILVELIDVFGPSSETCSLLGRVYKDRSDVDHAIAAYRQGFEADWRDAFPGINALTLMELEGRQDAELLTLVRYANRRRVDPDYWDHATRLELAVIARDEPAAREAFADALAAVREPWEPQSTAKNLGLIRAARAGRGEVIAWADQLEQTLRS